MRSVDVLLKENVLKGNQRGFFNDKLKVGFALAIYKKNKGFDNISFDGFEPLFEQIKKICNE